VRKLLIFRLFAFKILTGKPTRKRFLGRPMHRKEANIRMLLKEISVNDIGLIQLRAWITGDLF
jgi:hypothetical protein